MDLSRERDRPLPGQNLHGVDLRTRNHVELLSSSLRSDLLGAKGNLPQLFSSVRSDLFEQVAPDGAWRCLEAGMATNRPPLWGCLSLKPTALGQNLGTRKRGYGPKG